MFLRFLSSLVLISSTVFADNKVASDNYQKALGLYQQRAVLDANGQYGNVFSAIEILKNAAVAADDEDLKFDISILSSRCNYWIGQHADDKDTKLNYFQVAMDATTEAKAINDDYAEAYYYYGVALGRWAEANGVTSSLGRKDELMQSMKETKVRTTRTDAKGETIDGMGPDRILGRTYYKLPFFAGGSRSESLKHLGTAYKAEPKYFLNGIFYAETLADGGSNAETAQACQILKDISLKNPEDGYTTRIPENKEDIVDAAKAFKKICD
jgi:tetratricopeptide (TPR) repeat protein